MKCLMFDCQQVSYFTAVNLSVNTLYRGGKNIEQIWQFESLSTCSQCANGFVSAMCYFGLGEVNVINRNCQQFLNYVSLLLN